eukprot:s1950_g6.t1
MRACNDSATENGGMADASPTDGLPRLERFYTARSSLSLLSDEAKGAAAENRKRRRSLAFILFHQLSAVALSILTLHARSQLLLKAFGGDDARVARHVGVGSAMVSFLDLVLSPLAGRASDCFGRRPMMLLLPAVSLPLKLLSLSFPTALVLLVERVITDSLRTLCGTTMTMTCLADLYDGPGYTAALGSLNAATGAALVLAPQLATLLIGRRGVSPRRAFAGAAALAAIHYALASKFLQAEAVYRYESGYIAHAPKKDYGPLDFTGKIAGGLRLDIRRRAPFFCSDWTDAFMPENFQKSVSSILYLFIAALAPAITFGSRFLDGTNGQFGVLEMIMSTSVSGMIFSSTAGQPLSILGATGPFLAYTLVVYDLAIAVDVEFMPFYFWTCMWCSLFTILVAVFDLCALMKHVTMFSEDIFAGF